jgi:shikimate kinase
VPSRRPTTRKKHTRPVGHGRPTLFLTGFMASGKTTVGKILAARLDAPFVDVDETVAARAGMTVPQIFSRLGEPAFRRLEREALQDLPGGAVVALGAGAVPPPEGTVVWLQASVDEMVRRLAWGPVRPMLQGTPDVRAKVEDLLRTRVARYRRADLAVDTTGRTPESVADEVETWIRSR